MKTVGLGEICSFRSGSTLPSGLPFEQQPKGWLLLKVGDLNLPENESTIVVSREWSGTAPAAAIHCPPDSIVLPKRGGAIATNKKRYLTRDAALDPNLMGVVPDQSKVDARYLFAWFNRFDLTSISNGSTVPQLNIKDLQPLRIPFPPLSDQRRIAAVLDATEALRAKRREALAQLDTLLQATFLDLFGDPITNPKGWKFVPMGEAGTSFEGGKNYNPTDDERADGYRVLKVSAVTSGAYRPDESKPFAEEEAVPAEYVVRDGDLLISRANTSELVGAVAHVRKASGREVLPDKLWRFVWSEPQVVEPLYMLHIARSKYFRRHLIQRATGTSGSMKNIGKEKMLGIPIPLPPIVLQRRFADAVDLIDDQRERLGAHLAELDTLFASLQSRAFRGEL